MLIRRYSCASFLASSWVFPVASMRLGSSHVAIFLLLAREPCRAYALIHLLFPSLASRRSCRQLLSFPISPHPENLQRPGDRSGDELSGSGLVGARRSRDH